MKRLGVVGWPVAHSKSPQMQNAALEAAGLSDSWNYELVPAEPDLAADLIRGLTDAGFVGANVTIPHKELALEVADSCDPMAKQIGAANHLEFRDGQIHAENTDAVALASFAQSDFEGGLNRKAFAGKRVLVLGAGGTGRTAVSVTSVLGADSVSVWNRTIERAARIADEFGVECVKRPTLGGIDVLINTTTVGMDPTDTLEDIGIVSEAIAAVPYVVDFVYADHQTPLTTAAQEGGTTLIDGRELLVRQGAVSFQKWTGVAPDLDVMRAAIA